MRRFNLKKIAIVLGISGVVIWGAGTSFAKIMDKNNLKNKDEIMQSLNQKGDWRGIIKSLGNYMSVKSVSIRIEEEMLNKIAYVADYEGRSVNSHVLVLIRKNIKEFEDKNGAIDESIKPDLNVKPGRK